MKILIVEDDRNVAEMLREGLTAESHTVELADDGASGSFLGRSYDYDAIILDHSLPKKNGLSVCREVRAAGKTTPIIFLSVTAETETKLAAFENGADDYVTKPFSLAELQARLKLVTHRRPRTSEPRVEVADLILDAEKLTVTRAGKHVPLTRKEFSLTEYFMRHPGVILSRAQIMEHVWTAESDPFSNTVEAHIRNVRKKLNLGKKANLIANVPGRGYVMDTPNNLEKF